jgi:hypothetical protein
VQSTRCCRNVPHSYMVGVLATRIDDQHQQQGNDGEGKDENAEWSPVPHRKPAPLSPVIADGVELSQTSAWVSRRRPNRLTGPEEPGHHSGDCVGVREHSEVTGARDFNEPGSGNHGCCLARTCGRRVDVVLK